LTEKSERVYASFREFLPGFIRDLNHRSEEGWFLLVEGPRDRRAILRLGYLGTVLTVSHMGKRDASEMAGKKKAVILTDMDREGAALAARLMRKLRHEGFEISLSERRRLRAASHGVFLHVENLQRFAPFED
jgi:5S rRNA maturation endonuclease (ribonuclease M5)